MKHSTKRSCILLTSDHDHLSCAAEACARALFEVRHVSRYARGAKRLAPEVAYLAQHSDVDFLFNFLSPVIVPADVLECIRSAAINFHPAPPEWPGIGSASFAIYHDDESFGATAHVMTPQVDAGPIVRTVRFAIEPDDDCEQLFDRALNYSLFLLYEVLSEVAHAGTIRPTGQKWKREAVTRDEFEEFMRIGQDDSADDIMRKARALRHSKLPGPFVEIGSLRFHLPAGASLPPLVTKFAHVAREAA